MTFSERKATQAAAIVLKSCPIPIGISWMPELLYMADRESIKETGSPMIGETFGQSIYSIFSVEVFRCAHQPGAHPFWSRHIRSADRQLRLIADPGDGELSDFDVDVLSRVHKTHSGRPELTEWTARKRQPGATLTAPVIAGRLPIENIMRAVGMSEAEVAATIERNAHVAAVERACV